jgi:hypothetical protein
MLLFVVLLNSVSYAHYIDSMVSLLNKTLSLALPLGIAKFMANIAIENVAVCGASKVHLRCSLY